jgi:fumarate reductase flavoprotein subunit
MTGDGMTMAGEVGANTDDQLAMLLLGPLHNGGRGVGLLFRRPYLMTVNKNGERFYDESVQLHGNPDDIGNTVDRQRDKTCYALLDSETKQYIIQNGEALSGAEAVGIDNSWKDTLEAEFKKDTADGTAKIADTLEEIAGYIGAEPSVLKAEVERYNSFCDKGYDADFLKDRQYLRPLRQPPYYAIEGRQDFNTTFGGIKINYRTEVLNKRDMTIGGLYAAGDNAGSWAPATYSHRYPGSAVSFALCSGYIAGENAARYVLGSG